MLYGTKRNIYYTRVDHLILETDKNQLYEHECNFVKVDKSEIHEFKFKGTWEFLGFVDAGLNQVAIVSDHKKTGKLNFSQID